MGTVTGSPAIDVMRAPIGSRAPARRAVDLFGVSVDALTMSETVEAARQLVLSGQPSHHLAINAAKVVRLAHDAELRQIAHHAALVSVDGMAVVWASRMLGRPVPERVTGIDLMDELLAVAARDGWRVYFLGASAEVVAETAEVERLRHPGLQVAGFRDGYWTAATEDQVVAEVAAACADLLLVALPTPRKERFCARHLEALGVPLVVGVGGSFDVVAGRVSRAPRWMQRAGLEWLHRLAQEPGRMWKRYLVGNTRFALLVLQQLWRVRWKPLLTG